MISYRQVGGRLGAFVRTNEPSIQQIHGLLADLLAGDKLLQTMREVTTRPKFIVLLELAGSGRGVVERDALLQELSDTYLPAIVDEVGQLLNGLLDQPAGNTIYSIKEDQQAEEDRERAERQERAIRDITTKYEEARQEIDRLKLANELRIKAEEAGSRIQNSTRKAKSYRDERAPKYLESRVEELQRDERRRRQQNNRTLDPSYDPAYRYIRNRRGNRTDSGINPSYDPAYEYIDSAKETRNNGLAWVGILIVFIIGFAIVASS